MCVNDRSLGTVVHFRRDRVFCLKKKTPGTPFPPVFGGTGSTPPSSPSLESFLQLVVPFYTIAFIR